MLLDKIVARTNPWIGSFLIKARTTSNIPTIPRPKLR